MNILDIILILIIISQALRWAAYGFSRGFFSLAGYWAGLVGGALLTPFAIGFVDAPLAKLTVAVLLIFGLATLFGSLGQIIGEKVFHLINKARLNMVDGLLGSIFSIAMTLVIIWLVSSILSGTPFQNINQQMQQSAVVRAVNNAFPPAPAALARIGGLINPNNFPQVFLDPEPQQIAPVEPPSSAEIAAALEAAGRSTVRIESLGCGGKITGSGFVADQNVIVTNAHVVAGIDRPTVVDVHGRHDAYTIYFNPDLDIAVLRVEDGSLAGRALTIASQEYPRGTTSVTLGYPGGGPLRANSAGVMSSVTAVGANIYGQRGASRPIYILQTMVESGNSGGPVVLSDGTVIGVIFARSENQENVGYAIRSTEVAPIVNAVSGSTRPVSTGMCVNS